MTKDKQPKQYKQPPSFYETDYDKYMGKLRHTNPAKHAELKQREWEYTMSINDDGTGGHWLGDREVKVYPTDSFRRRAEKQLPKGRPRFSISL